MQGFKEDFDAWRSKLTPEEKSLVNAQAKGTYNKKFRKSDTFNEELPEDKMDSFNEIMGKFISDEDAMKESKFDGEEPDGGLLFKANAGTEGSGMSFNAEVIDRDAERRFQSAQQKRRDAELKGEYFFPGSPRVEEYDGTKDYAAVRMVLEDFMADLKKKASQLDEGEKAKLKKAVEDGSLKRRFEELEKEVRAKHGKSMEEVEQDVVEMKAYYASAKDEMKKQTKADLLKALWKAYGEANPDTDMPELEEDLLADLAKIPAVEEGAFKHPWGTASKLYKAEIIDPQRNKYLLGVYETEEEAKKAYDDWYVEYEKEKASQTNKMNQWGKQEMARLNNDLRYGEASKRIQETVKAMEQ